MIFNENGDIVQKNTPLTIKKCFLICPIGKKDSNEYERSDKLMNEIINPVCKIRGYIVIRADKIKSTNKIDDEILDHLKNDDLAIADLTGCNPNVLYEIGYRSGREKPIIHMAQTNTTLPFDISHIRTIFYDFDSIEEVQNDISETMDNLKCQKSLYKMDIYDNKKIENCDLLLKEIVHGKNNAMYYGKDHHNAIVKELLNILQISGYIKTKVFNNDGVYVTATPSGIELVNSYFGK